MAECSYHIHVEMSNQQLVDAGMKTMDETDQAIERSKQVEENCHPFLYVTSVFDEIRNSVLFLGCSQNS